MAVNTTECNSPTSPSSVVMQLCSQYMEPLHKVKNFGIINPGAQWSKEVVSLPNLLFGSDTRTPQIRIKFYWKLFKLVRKRFIRPEKTPKNQSINALRVELSKVDNHAILKNQQITGDKSKNTSLQINFNSFKMPFQVCDQSLFKLGCDLSFFELDKKWGTALTSDDWDDLLHNVYVEEETFELNKTSFGTLTSQQSLDSTIIDLCLKW